MTYVNYILIKLGKVISAYHACSIKIYLNFNLNLNSGTISISYFHNSNTAMYKMKVPSL